MTASAERVDRRITNEVANKNRSMISPKAGPVQESTSPADAIIGGHREPFLPSLGAPSLTKGLFLATVFSLMGQQSNKVQKRRRRINYKKRQKIASKTTAATAKPAAKPAAAPAKKAPAAKAAPAEKAVAAPAAA